MYQSHIPRSNPFTYYLPQLSGLIVKVLCLVVASVVFGAVPAKAQELANDTLRLKLGTNPQGIPFVQEGDWVSTGLPAFTDVSVSDGMDSWLAGQISQGASSAEPWSISSSKAFLVAKASQSLAGGITISWVVELAKQGSLFRVHVQLTNGSRQAQAVDSFPVWLGTWQIPKGPNWVRWWDSISYQRHEKDLMSGGKITLGSHLYSSADGGENPYWIVGGGAGRLYFGLEWSGGWQTRLKAKQDTIKFSVSLPEDETQLVLKPQETMDGPALIVWPTSQRDDLFNRRSWMQERLALAKQIYGGPAPSFPLIYNHWYAIRGDVDGAFLSRQVPALSAYGFDAFVVDLGWFGDISNWSPDPTKFAPGEFESLLQSIKSSGRATGLWSTPQFISPGDESPSQQPDSPPDFVNFLDGYLLDLWGSDFADRLTGHVELLRRRYSVNWWKYDQPFFQDQSRSGAMKNATAFQSALKAARSANPDLIIENCMDGGHIVNEFTLLCTQISWLADGKNNDLDQMRANVQSSLGAMDFVFPGAVERSINRPDELDGNDELTRYYCRSAMAGTWWISADLPLISDHQRELILKEVANYRKLNEIKQEGLYHLQQPQDGADVAGVTFYSMKTGKAAVLLYRWDGQGAFVNNVTMKALKSLRSYTVTDADTGIQTQMRGKDLISHGYPVTFSSDRMSAILFVDVSN